MSPWEARGRPFVKMHGLRNHFVVVDGREAPYRPDVDEIVRLCDVQVGVGAEQLVVVEPPTPAGLASGATAFMRLYNVDGREVEACGNATRCVAWLLLTEAGVERVAVETHAGVLPCARAGDRLVRSALGRVQVQARSLGLSSGPLRGGVGASVGNPHVVFFVDDLDAVDVAAWAPAVQADPAFPEGVNVGVAQRLGPDALRLVVYERGAGLTMACGTGACAATRVALELGVVRSARIAVHLPGGQLDVEVTPDGTAITTGPVARCFSGRMW